MTSFVTFFSANPIIHNLKDSKNILSIITVDNRGAYVARFSVTYWIDGTRYDEQTDRFPGKQFFLKNYIQTIIIFNYY